REAHHRRQANGRPKIAIDTDEHRVVCETVAALNADPDIYMRGEILVRVIRAAQPRDGIVRADGSATISALPAPNLRERITRYADFIRVSSKGDETPLHPTTWLVSAVHARGEWPGIRHLLGVSDAPVMRRDGSVHQSPGFDPATGVLFEPTIPFP